MARSDRVLGAAIGVGAIAGFGILLLSRGASAMTSGSPRERERDREPSPGGSPGGRFLPLVERWRSEVEKRAKGLPIVAVLAWIAIESGGDTCATGGPNEVGIFQLMFPGDAKYGATLEGLRAICEKSKLPGFDISQLSEAELDMEVGAGINKILASRDIVRQVFGQNHVTWPETSFDFGSAVKQIHATPAVITELLPKITRRDGAPPASWGDLRQKVMAYPVGQMGQGLQRLTKLPSRHGLSNLLEDTMRNAEIVGRAWGSARATSAFVGRAWRAA